MPLMARPNRRETGMAEKKGGTPGESPRRRAAPTIDLKATEVKAESPAQADAKQEPETEPGPHPTREFIAAAEGRPVDPPRSTFSYVMAGLAGAVLVAVLMFGLWLSGMVPIRYAGATAMRARVSVLEMQLQNLQKNANDGSSAAALEDAKARIARLEQAPAKPREADAQTAERLGKLETAMQGLGLALAGLQKRADEIAGAIALNNERYGETQNRLAAL